MKTFRIDGRMIGQDCEPYIIAEAGINHNGDIDLAKKMILAAKEAGVDAVKFQTFHSEEFIQDQSLTYTYTSQGKEVTESMLDMFRRNEFTESEWFEIKRFCDENEITFLSTPQNYSDLELLLRVGIAAIKVGSDDFVNIPLVRSYAKYGLPMVLSCGMADEEEIGRTLREVELNPTALLVCTSQYPTPEKDVNILKLNSIREKFPNVIPGLSDHTQGTEAAVMAVALGACVFEKHFTLSHDLPGPDHWFSEEPKALKQWVYSIRRAWRMRGFPELRPTEDELEMRKIAHRSITVVKNIHAGDVFSEENLAMRRPGTGMPSYLWDDVIGKKAKRDLVTGCQLEMGDIDR